MFKANVDQNLAAVLDNCPDIILVIDLLGQIVFVNKTAENELGYTSEEMKSQKINELSDVSITTFNKNHVEVESCHRQFANLLKKNGNLYPVELRYSKCSIKENEYVIAYCRKSEDGVFKDASFLINDKNFRAIARNIQGMIYREGADRSVKIITNSEFISGYKTEDFVSNKKKLVRLNLGRRKGKGDF